MRSRCDGCHTSVLSLLSSLFCLFSLRFSCFFAVLSWSNDVDQKNTHVEEVCDQRRLKKASNSVVLTPNVDRDLRASKRKREKKGTQKMAEKNATRVFSTLRTTSCSEHDPCAVCRKVACLQNQSCSQPLIGTGKTYRRFVACLLERGTVSAQVAFSVSLQAATLEAFLASLESSRTSRGGPVSPGCAKSIFSSLCVVTDCMVKRAPTEDKREAKRQRKVVTKRGKNLMNVLAAAGLQANG